MMDAFKMKYGESLPPGSRAKTGRSEARSYRAVRDQPGFQAHSDYTSTPRWFIAHKLQELRYKHSLLSDLWLLAR